MRNIDFRKIKIFAAVVCLICALLCGGVSVYAAEDGEVRVTAQSSLTGGQSGSAVVTIDCGDRVFVKGNVKIRLPGKSFGSVSALGDTDIKCNVTADAEYIAVDYSFDIAGGLHDTVQLGTVSFVLINDSAADTKAVVEIIEVNLIDDKGGNDVSKIALKNADVVIKPGVPLMSQTPDASATAGVTATTDVTVMPGSTATATATATDVPTATPSVENSAKPTASAQEGQFTLRPQVTSSTEILTDTDVYTREDIEDLSAGAIVFWSIVSLVAGIWIGIGFGYMFWNKKKGKPQVKDSNSHVIGHLK